MSRWDAWKATRAAFALLGFGFHLILFMMLAKAIEPHWLPIAAIIMEGIAALMCAIEL